MNNKDMSGLDSHGLFILYTADETAVSFPSLFFDNYRDYRDGVLLSYCHASSLLYCMGQAEPVRSPLKN
jgi:hypothetical protein